MRNHSVKELIATYGKLSAILGVNNLVIIGGLAIKFLCYGKRRVNDIDVTYTKRKTAKLFDTRKGVLAKSGFKVVRFGRSDKFRLIDKENAVGVDFSSRRWSGRYKKFTLATSKIKRVRLGNMTIKLNLASPEVLFLLKSVSLD
ncbi:MAG: hypothetical protein KGH98_04775, partial [Candidatus Micrarchaeota archaeon]|nr:hypothetical protein [Candidatus Micrarchaeota archaeon]